LKGRKSTSRPAYSLARFVHFALFLLIPGVLFAQSSEDATSDDPATFNGYLSTRYVYRSSGDVTDQDLFGELRMDMTSPKEHQYEFHFFGTARADVDGNSDRHDFNPLEDIGDTYRSSYHGYLYEAHFDVNNFLPRVPQVRLGRQAGVRDEQVFFDGLAAEVRVADSIQLSLYGGAAVHFFEVGSHWGDDSLAGAAIDYTPWLDTKLSLDYLTVEDTQSYPASVELTDRMVSLKLWQRLGSIANASVKYRTLNGERRDVSVRALSAFPEADFQINLNYFRQFRTQEELSNELSLYYAVLGASAPYESYDLKLRKLFGAHFAVDAGYFKRSLLESGQESAFDRDYTRTFFFLEFIDLPADRVSFTIICEQWETEGREFQSAGLDAGYVFKKGRNAKINLGTYYSLYKYDYYVEKGLSENVRTYYVNGTYPVTKSFSLNGRYEFETGMEKYQTLRLGLRYDF
jgi:hypothetical protein